MRLIPATVSLSVKLTKDKFLALYIKVFRIVTMDSIDDFLAFSVNSESNDIVIPHDGDFNRKSVVRVQIPTSDASVAVDIDDDDAVGDVICCWARDASSRQLQLTGDRYRLRQDDICNGIITM